MAHCYGCGSLEAPQDGSRAWCDKCDVVLRKACADCQRWVRERDWEDHPRLKQIGSRPISRSRGRSEGYIDYRCTRCGTGWTLRYQYDAGTGSDDRWFLTREEGGNG